LGGKPLAGAEIYFVGEKISGFGKTDAEGRYELVQGAAPGKNKVYISKIEGAEGLALNTEQGMDIEQLRTAAQSFESDNSQRGKVDPSKLPKEIVPPEFSDPTRTKLSFTVPEGGTSNADFRL
jgi:hypothetical protein